MSQLKVLDEEPLSLFQILGPQSSTCGYCSPPGQSSRTKSSKSFGMWAHQLSCSTYKKLIDRGWRRSGSYLYKPDMRATCCAQYTIRLQANAFKPSKSQRSILSRFNGYFRTGGKEGQPGYGPKTVLAPSGAQAKGASTAATPDRKGKGKRKGKHSQTFDLRTTLAIATEQEGAAHTFTVNMEPAGCTREKFELYKRYQVEVHGDKESKLTESSFSRFLCESPLKPERSPSSSQPYGSFHQMYRIDGRLVAIGVLDILPGAVSGVYFLYDPDWSALSLGKVSALRECSLTVDLEEAGFGEMFYMMGYYIHTCQKMRYKADYSPSFLLDPETYQFYPFDGVCRPQLDQDDHAIFSAHTSPSLARDRELASPPEQNRSVKKPGGNAEDGDRDSQSESDDEGEDEDEWLSEPPPPGFLTPNDLPFDLLKTIYSFESGRVVPLLLSKAWRMDANAQRKLRQGIAAMGEAAQETCIFV